jgi:2-keto-4-pentenoate hydratase
MTIDRPQRAADLLRHHRDRGTRLDALPPEIRPETRAEGYTIQEQIENESSAPLFGWKIAATSLAGQAHVDVDGPLVGRILAEQRLIAGDVYALGNNHMCVGELEFVFRFRRDIPPRHDIWTATEAVAEVDSLYIAIEIPDSRYENYDRVGAPQLIADNACAHRFLLGPEASADWRALDLSAHAVTGLVDDIAVERGGGGNVLGDPRAALAWFLCEQARYHLTVRKGQVVTTGTCVQPIKLRPNTTLTGDFGVLGRVSLRIAT